MNLYLQVLLASALWCIFHSLFITAYWQDTVCERFPACAVYSRLVYVMASSLSLGVLFLWLRTLPEESIWAWTGWWQAVRVVGLFEAALLFYLGSRAYDGRAFLGLRQVADQAAGRPISRPALSTDGILGMVRHPWYTASLILLVFGLPYTDVNLVWRAVFIAYFLVGTELEERKLIAELGERYLEYRRQVPRYFPSLRPRRRD